MENGLVAVARAFAAASLTHLFPPAEPSAELGARLSDAPSRVVASSHLPAASGLRVSPCPMRSYRTRLKLCLSGGGPRRPATWRRPRTSRLILPGVRLIIFDRAVDHLTPRLIASTPRLII